jgi:hypothetical protein
LNAIVKQAIRRIDENKSYGSMFTESVQDKGANMGPIGTIAVPASVSTTYLKIPFEKGFFYY